MNWQAPAGSATGAVQVAEPSADQQTQRSFGGAEDDWLCASCLSCVTNEKDRFAYGGKDEFVFVNPEGIRFKIITFSRAPGCREAGIPTLKFTWFADHTWCYGLCGGCGRHLGWYYSGQHEFVGLIAERLVRAVYLRN